MRALASFQDLYVGVVPYRNNELLGGGVLKSTAPAVFGLLFLACWSRLNNRDTFFVQLYSN
jgi:hypothetical protein